jgi:hypothetical protein
MIKCTAILIFFSVSLTAQVSEKVQEIVAPLESVKGIRLESFREDQARFQQLFDFATNDELYYLSLSGKSPYVKADAAKALMFKGDVRIFDVFRQLLSAKDSIEIGTTCLRDNLSLPDYIYQVYNFDYKIAEDEKERGKIAMIRTILGQPEVDIALLEKLQYWIPADESYYGKIRRLTAQSRSPLLLACLAKYHKPEDIDFIKSFGKGAFGAIEEFPDPEFLGLLEAHVDESDNFQFMFALSKFCDPRAVALVERSMRHVISVQYEGCDSTCLMPFYDQVTMEKCAKYYPVLAQMWPTHKIISMDVYENFKATHSGSETQKFLLDGFMSKGEATVLTANSYNINPLEADASDMFGGGQDAVVGLLKELKNYSTDDYEKAVRNCILQSGNYELVEFGDALGDNEMLAKMTDAYLSKMESAEDSYELLLVMDEIKKGNNSEAFNKGFAIIRKRKKDFKKDDALQELKAFLNANHLKL